MARTIAAYVRVSKSSQDQASQIPDIERWLNSQEGRVHWYKDTATGKNMDRPGWIAMMRDIEQGKVATVVVWRLDRLGRTARGLTAFFEELVTRKVNLVSLKDGLDLATPAGRMMAGVLASVAQYETEIRAERVHAGLAVARERGTRSGRPIGRPKGSGRPLKVTSDQETLIRRLASEGTSKMAIARMTGLHRETVAGVIAGA